MERLIRKLSPATDAQRWVNYARNGRVTDEQAQQLRGEASELLQSENLTESQRLEVSRLVLALGKRDLSKQRKAMKQRRAAIREHTKLSESLKGRAGVVVAGCNLVETMADAYERALRF